jgi:hypothetical protein
MMKKSNDHYYHGIVTFEDFRLEKERLILKSKLIEAKINMEIIMIREVFSVSNLVFSFAKEYILPKISGIFSEILNLRTSEEE